MPHRSRLIAVIALLAAMLLWASSFVALKMAFQSYAPLFVIFGRMVVGSLCFVFLLKSFKGNQYQRGDLKYLLFLVICEPCLYFLFEAKALVLTTASQAGMVTAVLPLMVGIAAHFLLKERVTMKTYAGFVIAILGVFLLSAGAKSSSMAPNPALGNFLEFLAMVCATGYTISLKHLSARYTPLSLTALQAFVGSLFFLPFVLLHPGSIPSTFEPVAGLSIIYLGIFVTLGAYGLYNFGVSRIPASQASAFVNLIPVLTVILSWIILGDRFTFLQYAAGILVFLGVFLSQDVKVGGVPPAVQ